VVQAPSFERRDQRRDDEPRPLEITLDFVKYPEGSVLARAGDTVVVCNVTVEGRVPPFLRDTGEGWLTSEYAMLPRATEERTPRDVSRGSVPGRSAEIQRLIGRSLRAALDAGTVGAHAAGGLRRAPGRWRHPHHRDHRRVRGGRLRYCTWKGEGARRLAVGPGSGGLGGIVAGRSLLDLNWEDYA
jgi:ribonuclease PH